MTDNNEHLLNLAGKVAVVTGGSSGIGAAITRRLSWAGARVAILDKDLSGASGLVRELAGCREAARAYHVDITEQTSIMQALSALQADLGPASIWVNNAGIYPASLAIDMDMADWDRVIATNLRGTFAVSVAAAKHMLDAGIAQGGVVINVASVSGLRGRRTLAAYTASKHGIIGLTKTLALEFADMGTRVLAVAPTIIDTPGMRARGGTTEYSTLVEVKKMEQSILNNIPLGRVGTPDDVAKAVLFCASEMAAFMTGSTIIVDGGAMIQ